MKGTRFIVVIVCLVCLTAVAAQSQIPPLISYSAVATEADGTPLPEGGHTMIFSLYEQATGGQAVWTEEYDAQNPVQVGAGGAFNVILGSLDPATNPLDLQFDQPYFLGIAIDGGTEGTPRVELTSAPYSLGSAHSLTIADGALEAGDNITISRNGTTQRISSTDRVGITGVTAGSGLTGGGTSGNPTVNVGGGTGITVSADAVSLNTGFADGRYVNEGQALASGVAVKSINSLTDVVTLVQGDNVTIVTEGNKLRISALGTELPDNAVTSVKIKDGEVKSVDIGNQTITNNDISNNAAIAGTKIIPNFGSRDILTTGSVDIGMTPSSRAKLQVFGDLLLRNTNNTTPSLNAAEFFIGWNKSGGKGETCFWSSRKAGWVGGFDFWVDDGSRPIFQIRGNGEIRVLSSLVHSSDRRLKHDIMPLKSSLEKVLLLQGISYRWNKNAKLDDNLHMGIIAQEVEKILPDLVTKDEADDGMLSINYIGMIPLLIEALKEQQQIINTLSDRLSKLE